ncbi:MAG: acetate--CoA ligase family protein [Alphaproteobacteria bacterium]
MTTPITQNLMRLLRPRHVAVLGGRDAEVVAGECRRIGYSGPFWPVNPKRDQIGGFDCFKSIEDLPEAPDAVFVAVPREQAIESLAQLNAMGAGGAVVYTAGFAEIGGDGADKEAALIEAAGDMAIIGPNCYGVINYVDKVALWPFAHGGAFSGRGAAIITQSGMLSSDLTMAQRSLPLSYMMSVGNQAMLRLEDFVDTLAQLDEVSAIGIHIEGIKDSQRFEAAARRALERNIPIVALKTGVSELGRELTISHTGSLSGADEAYDAFFERLGIIRVTEPAMLLETLKFITVAGVPKGRRLVGLACSGGGATMVADNAERLGLELPRPRPETETSLRAQLPITATVSNPLDYTTPIWGFPDKTEPVFKTLFADGYDAAVIIQDYPAAGLDESKIHYRNDSISFINAAKAAGLPAAVCSTIAENLDQETREFLIANGVAPMQGIGDCLGAISAATKYGQARQKILDDPDPPLVRLTPSGVGEDQGNSTWLDEGEAKAMLRDIGIDVPSAMVVHKGDEIQLLAGMEFPVAVKILSPDIPHKSEIGAVKLGIKNMAELTTAIADIDDAVSRHAPDARTNGFLVEMMAQPPVAEVLVSLRRDPTFGIIVTIASGGVLVELIKDSKTILAPCTDARIAAAIDQLAVTRIIDGYRGGATGDKQGLVKVVARLVAAMTDDAGLALIELNPLFVGADRVVAVDALVARY